MVAPEVQGIDLFKIAGRSISGWVPSYKTGTVIRQPFCSQLEERLLLWLEYHPLVASYARGDIGPEFATKYRLPIPQHAPFAIGYTFENQPHHYLPDVVGTLANGTPFIAEAGMEDDKRGDRNLVKAQAARRLVCLQQGTFWIGTERQLSKRRHYNLVFLHARRKMFPAFADIAEALASVWPWGEMAPVSEVVSRLAHQFPVDLVEAAIWKVVADSAAAERKNHGESWLSAMKDSHIGVSISKREKCTVSEESGLQSQVSIRDKTRSLEDRTRKRAFQAETPFS